MEQGLGTSELPSPAEMTSTSKPSTSEQRLTAFTSVLVSTLSFARSERAAR